jgi:hypothetical protein
MNCQDCIYYNNALGEFLTACDYCVQGNSKVNYTAKEVYEDAERRYNNLRKLYGDKV